MTAQPWRFGSGALGVDLTIYVTGDPEWQRPSRARLVEDPQNGPPTLLTRGGPLGKRRIALQFYVPWDLALESHLNALRTAYNQRGPYVLFTHREILNVVFDASQGLRETDYSGYFLVGASLLEI